MKPGRFLAWQTLDMYAVSRFCSYELQLHKADSFVSHMFYFHTQTPRSYIIVLQLCVHFIKECVITPQNYYPLC